MSERSFHDAAARAAARAAVEAVEAQTAAEVVIALRRSSGRYQDADYLAGALLSLVTLALVLLVPRTFSPWALLVDVLLGFVIGVVLSAYLATVRRSLTAQARRRRQVRDAARVAFVDLGVSRTRWRLGVLVYLSIFERDLEVVPDVGVDVSALGEDWPRAIAAMRDAVGRLDFEAFRAATLALGPILGRVHPRQAGDVNELPDEVGLA